MEGMSPMTIAWSALAVASGAGAAFFLLVLVSLNRSEAKNLTIYDRRHFHQALRFLGLTGLFAALPIIPLAALAIYAFGKAWEPAAVFQANAGFLGILVFLVEHALKGIFVDALEIYEVEFPGAAVLDTRKHWGLAGLLVFYRAAFAGAALYLALRVIRVWRRTRVFVVGNTRFVINEESFVKELMGQPIFNEWLASIDETRLGGNENPGRDGIRKFSQLAAIDFILFVIDSAERGWSEAHHWQKVADLQALHDRIFELNPHVRKRQDGSLDFSDFPGDPASQERRTGGWRRLFR